jgi:hypothetical protein
MEDFSRVDAWVVLLGSLVVLVYFLGWAAWLVREKRRGAWR